MKIPENKPELKTGNGVQAQRDRIKLNAFVVTFSTELKIWSFQVVDVQDGREMQSGCFAYWNYHVFDLLLVWLGCASKLSTRWSARAVKPRGDGGRSKKKPFLFFSQFGGSFARSIFLFSLPAPPRPLLQKKRKNRAPATQATALRAITAIRWTRHQARQTIPGARCGICVT